MGNAGRLWALVSVRLKQRGLFGFEQVAFGFFGDDALIAELGEGGAEGGGAHGAKLSQLRRGDGAIKWGESLADALSRGFLRPLGRCWAAWHDLPGIDQR